MTKFHKYSNVDPATTFICKHISNNIMSTAISINNNKWRDITSIFYI